MSTEMDADAAELALAEFEESDLARRYPAIAPSWRRAWNEVIPFLDYPPEVRRLIYTTNAIEALERVAPDQIQDSHGVRPVIPCL